MVTQLNDIQQATQFIQKATNHFQPEIAMILGSGLGPLADSIEAPIYLPYTDIPGIPTSTVKGHAGRFVFGMLNGKRVMVMQGRLHFYEGIGMEKIALPIRVMKNLGVQNLIITTATGGVNLQLKAGDLMLITDHINFVFHNPLIGENLDQFGPRFPDTSEIYTPALADIAREAAKENNIDLKEGTYLFVTGPTYETPAEVKMMQFLGTDVVGMSTFPEALVAGHCGLKVVGITYVANMAAGISKEPLSHDDVMETMKLVKDDFINLVNTIVEKI